MSFDLKWPAAEFFKQTAQALPRMHEVDMPPRLISAGTYFALAGHIQWANELWRRALAPGLPHFRHAYGFDPLIGACAGAGLSAAPDGKEITAAEIERIDVDARLRMNRPPLTVEERGRLPSVPRVPTRPGTDLLQRALELVRPREGHMRFDGAPSAEERGGLGGFRKWLMVVDRVDLFQKPELDAVLLLCADITERLGDHASSRAFVRHWFSSGGPARPDADAGTLLCLQSLSRIAAAGVLRDVLELTDREFEEAGRRLVDLADRRLAEGRATSREPFEWRTFLKTLSEMAIDQQGLHSHLISDDQRRHRWLGADPASEAAIARVETRLARRLPPSYRAFLQTSDGFGPVSELIPGLRPVERIEWFRVENEEWLKSWLEAAANVPDEPDADYFQYGDYQGRERPRYLTNALQISDVFDGGVILLVPDVIDEQGEWETWDFASWRAGASRFPNFREFMEEDSFASKTRLA
jgi:SMI1 / KNR4 family (SUKH-1)